PYCAIALFFSVFALLNFVLHRHGVLLVLASSSFRVSSSGHVLYHSRRCHRVSVVVGTYENGIGSLPRFYFCSFQKFLSVSFGVLELHLEFANSFVCLFWPCLCRAREEESELPYLILEVVKFVLERYSRLDWLKISFLFIPYTKFGCHPLHLLAESHSPLWPSPTPSLSFTVPSCVKHLGEFLFGVGFEICLEKRNRHKFSIPFLY
uniref:Uncharacterized protein n=1 Tax=Oryza glaberrima TaxID=4538 RepID=I1PDA4_ORYGL